MSRSINPTDYPHHIRFSAYCIWQPDPEEEEAWSSECGMTFPVEEGMRDIYRWCPYCGRIVAEKRG